MHAILDARDSVVVLPTGGGKSLCFQAPAIVRRGPRGRSALALVVSPLISLMKDQVDGLRVDGVAASYLNSTLLPHERDEVLASVREDRCRLLYVSPERIVGEGSQALRRMLQQAGLRFIAIDEAHCISQWGHDFRPEYRQLGRLRDDFPGVSFHAFTATATERVRRDIVTELRLHEPLVLVGSFDRPNLIYRVLRRGNLHRQLLDILARHERRGRHRLLLVAAGSGGARRMAAGRGAPRGAVSRRPARRGAEPPPGACFSTSASTSSSRRWRSAWGSIGRTCGSSSTPARRGRRSTTSRSRAAPAATACRPSACSSTRAAISCAGGRCSRANGEWNESARTLLRDMERYAAGTRCRHRSLVEYFGQPYERAGLRRVRLVPEGARSRSPIRRRWRRRSCRAWRA